MEERRDAFGVEPICRAIGVAASPFYRQLQTSFGVSESPSRKAVDSLVLAG